MSSAAAYTSTRLQVDTTIASVTALPSRSLRKNSGRSSAAIATRSRTATDAERYETPTTTSVRDAVFCTDEIRPSGSFWREMLIRLRHACRERGRREKREL